ncbi:kinetochore component CENP-S-domain-containing protein [Absidia repens]|uniref:Kinetochore component CENP-S-domain-containing protein n=1 Tax=Absidia repens TaxID=90262 RepID=A0A1X2IK15_9FUNG|nr:kinetochore component CENP-S-domain-containing protein [Absidia repens]
MSRSSESNALEEAVRVLVDRIVQEESRRLGTRMGQGFVDSLTNTVYKQMETFAHDTENFARHARRAVINADDVMLCARRNDDLYSILNEKRNELTNARAFGR